VAGGVKILVLTKRQYMGKDLLDDAYGRFYELPIELARLGHAVEGLCASYRRRDEKEVLAESAGARVRWRSLNVPPFLPWAITRWMRAAEEVARRIRPDLIWACSDAFHAALGARLQRRAGVPCAVDLYDNFEGYGASRIPGVTTMLRSAVRRAAGVTCVSGALRGYVVDRYRVRSPTLVLENGVSAEFRPRDRQECRQRLGLPREARIIGTAGALGKDRGIGLLYGAFLELAARDPRLHLVLAGRVLHGGAIPAHERIHYLGEMPLAEIPYVLGAMDVSVICNRRTAFGDYCFPQKLYEAIACRVPPLVAATQGVADLLRAAPRNLYEPESTASLVQGIERLLAQPEVPGVAPRTWAEHGVTLATFLEGVAASR
jgi:glycosyltransferase involved in cell wall biosynthesis